MVYDAEGKDESKHCHKLLSRERTLQELFEITRLDFHRHQQKEVAEMSCACISQHCALASS